MSEKIRVLLSEEEVDARIQAMGEQISRDYQGKQVHLVCVLKGGSFFMCELAKRITVPVSLDFMSVSSYGGQTKSSGIVKIVKDLDESLQDKDVIVFTDKRRSEGFRKIYRRSEGYCRLWRCTYRLSDSTVEERLSRYCGDTRTFGGPYRTWGG